MAHLFVFAVIIAVIMNTGTCLPLSRATSTKRRDLFGSDKNRAKAGDTLQKTASKQSSQMGVIITAGSSGAASSASTYGREEHTISDAERSIFGIEDSGLKTAVEGYKGRAPNDVFVKSPTPWDDLYTRYDWDQVKTTLVPVGATVLSISTEPIIVKSQIFENKSSQTATFNVFVSDTVSNSATSSWSTSGSFSVSQSIKYSVEVLGSGAEGTTSFSFESGWGEGGSETETVTLGSRSGVNVELEPGEAVQADLRASRGTMRVQVDYVANLSGYVACNYNPTFEGHHFWAFGVNSVLGGGNLAQVIHSSEIIEVGYYADSSVTLSDI